MRQEAEKLEQFYDHIMTVRVVIARPQHSRQLQDFVRKRQGHERWRRLLLATADANVGNSKVPLQAKPTSRDGSSEVRCSFESGRASHGIESQLWASSGSLRTACDSATKSALYTKQTSRSVQAILCNAR